MSTSNSIPGKGSGHENLSIKQGQLPEEKGGGFNGRVAASVGVALSVALAVLSRSEVFQGQDIHHPAEVHTEIRQESGWFGSYDKEYSVLVPGYDEHLPGLLDSVENQWLLVFGAVVTVLAVSGLAGLLYGGYTAPKREDAGQIVKVEEEPLSPAVPPLVSGPQPEEKEQDEIESKEEDPKEAYLSDEEDELREGPDGIDFEPEAGLDEVKEQEGSEHKKEEGQKDASSTDGEDDYLWMNYIEDQSEENAPKASNENPLQGSPRKDELASVSLDSPEKNEAPIPLEEGGSGIHTTHSEVSKSFFEDFVLVHENASDDEGECLQEAPEGWLQHGWRALFSLGTWAYAAGAVLRSNYRSYCTAINHPWKQRIYQCVLEETQKGLEEVQGRPMEDMIQQYAVLGESCTPLQKGVLELLQILNEPQGKFRDAHQAFLIGLRQLLESEAYRGEIQKEAPSSEALLLQQICYVRFTQVQITAFLDELMDLVMETGGKAQVGDLIEDLNEAEFEAIQGAKPEMGANVIAVNIQKFAGSANVGFDPHLKSRNKPYVLYDMELKNGKEVRVLRFGSPTIEGAYTDPTAKINPEFENYIRQLKATGKKHLYFSLQNFIPKGFGDETARNTALLQLAGKYPETFHFVCLAQDSAFYKQKAPFGEETPSPADFSQQFVAQIFDLDKAVSGFYLPESLKTAPFREESKALLDAVIKALYPNAEHLDKQQKMDAIEVFYAAFELLIMRKLEPDFMNITCKDAIDRAGKNNGLLSRLMAILHQRAESQEHLQEMKVITHSGAWVVKKQAVLHSRRTRLISARDAMKAEGVADSLRAELAGFNLLGNAPIQVTRRQDQGLTPVSNDPVENELPLSDVEKQLSLIQMKDLQTLAGVQEGWKLGVDGDGFYVSSGSAEGYYAHMLQATVRYFSGSGATREAVAARLKIIQETLSAVTDELEKLFEHAEELDVTDWAAMPELMRLTEALDRLCGNESGLRVMQKTYQHADAGQSGSSKAIQIQNDLEESLQVFASLRDRLEELVQKHQNSELRLQTVYHEEVAGVMEEYSPEQLNFLIHRPLSGDTVKLSGQEVPLREETLEQFGRLALCLHGKLTKPARPEGGSPEHNVADVRTLHGRLADELDLNLPNGVSQARLTELVLACSTPSATLAARVSLLKQLRPESGVHVEEVLDFTPVNISYSKETGAVTVELTTPFKLRFAEEDEQVPGKRYGAVVHRYELNIGQLKEGQSLQEALAASLQGSHFSFTERCESLEDLEKNHLSDAHNSIA